MIQLIRGFKDILPGEVELWQHIEKTARSLSESFGFKEIRIPILEHAELSMAFDWTCAFGLEGIIAELDFAGKSLKSQMKRADRFGAKHVLIVGEKELEEKAVILRNMTTKEQLLVPLDNLVKAVKDKIS